MNKTLSFQHITDTMHTSLWNPFTFVQRRKINSLASVEKAIANKVGNRIHFIILNRRAHLRRFCATSQRHRNAWEHSSANRLTALYLFASTASNNGNVIHLFFIGIIYQGSMRLRTMSSASTTENSSFIVHELFW